MELWNHLDDHDFVNRHLGPDAFRVDPLITKAPPPARSRPVRDTQPQTESLLGMNENNTVTLGTSRNETSSSQLAIKNCTEAHTSNDTEIDHFLEWVCEQDKRERQAMAYHYWAKTLQGVFEPPALPEGPDTTLVREQARRVLDDHHNALLGTAKAAYVIARGVSLHRTARGSSFTSLGTPADTTTESNTALPTGSNFSSAPRQRATGRIHRCP